MSYLNLLREKKKKEQKKTEEEILFLENGSLLLEELIASSRGIYNPIRTFSSDQIVQATNNFDWTYMISVDRFVWYKGMIENRRVLIKACRGKIYDPDNLFRDIAVSSLMSSHKNVLKLLGCCLEFSHPVLVCEYAEFGALTGIGRAGEGAEPFPWNIRLKIAKEITNAVTYLHTEFPRTIIHRDLKLRNIFLDENWTVKLSGFSLSIPIPEGETGVTDIICGTTSYIEPDYRRTGFVTGNVDVYSLGIIMLIFLTGKFRCYLDDSYVPLPDYVGKLLERGSFTELIDQSLLNNASYDHLRLQMEAFGKLALRCVRFSPEENVPHMIEVARELKEIENLT